MIHLTGLLKNIELSSWLSDNNLEEEEFIDLFQKIGVKELSDLKYIEESDLRGLNIIQKRKFLEHRNKMNL